MMMQENYANNIALPSSDVIAGVVVVAVVGAVYALGETHMSRSDPFPRWSGIMMNVRTALCHTYYAVQCAH